MSEDLSRFFPGLNMGAPPPAAPPAAQPAAPPPAGGDLSRFFNLDAVAGTAAAAGAAAPMQPPPVPPANSSPFSFHAHQAGGTPQKEVEPVPLAAPLGVAAPGGGAWSGSDDDVGSLMPTEPPGVRFPALAEQRDVVYRVEDNPRENHLEVTPITLYKTKYSEEIGHRIASNARYICYAVKNRVRAINRESVERELLRGHEHFVNDVRFFGDESAEIGSDVLASCSQGQLMIWRLSEVLGEDGKVGVGHEQLMHIKASVQRMVWHPTNDRVFAFVSGQCAVVVDMGRHGVATDGSRPAGQSAVELEFSAADVSAAAAAGAGVCRGGETAVRDACFSPRGDRLATCSVDGVVRVHALGQLGAEAVGNNSASAAEDFQLLSSFSPMAPRSPAQPYETSLAASCVEWFACPGGGRGDYLLTGVARNTQLELWREDPAAEAGFTSVQTVTLHGEQPAYEGFGRLASVNPSHDFVLLASTGKQSVVALHLDHSGGTLCFDYGTDFKVGQPVCAMALGDQFVSPEEGGAEQLEMQVFVVQTEHIQQYHIHCDQAYWPAEREAAAAPAAPPVTVPAAQVASTQAVAGAAGGSDDVEENNDDGEEEGEEQESSEEESESEESESEESESEEEESEEEESEEEEEEEGGGAASGASLDTATANAVGAPLLLSPGALVAAPPAPAAPLAPSAVVRGGRGPAPDGSASSSTPAGAIQDTGGLEARLLLAQQQSTAALWQKLEGAASAREKKQRAQQMQLLEMLSTTMNEGLPETVRDMVATKVGEMLRSPDFLGKPLQAAVTKAVKDAKLDKVARDAANAASKQSQAALEKVAGSVAAAMQPSIHAAFSKNFEQVLIPQFAEAVGRMSEQVAASFAGKMEAVTSQTAALAAAHQQQLAANKALTAQLATMQTSIDALTARVASGGGAPAAVAAAAAPAAAGGAAAAAEAAPAEVSAADTAAALAEQRRQGLLVSVAEGKYDKALHDSLSYNDVGFVLWLCANMNAKDVFETPLRVSQMILLCLVQQLGSDLKSDQELRLNWLRESLLVLETADAQIAKHVPQVLGMLQENIDRDCLNDTTHLAAGPTKDGFRVLQHIVKSKATE